MDDRGLAAWKLPLIVAAISVFIVAAFYVGGPALGMAGGSFVAGVIVAMAVRRPPLRPIVPARCADRREHLLVVVEEPLEDATAAEELRSRLHAAFHHLRCAGGAETPNIGEPPGAQTVKA